METTIFPRIVQHSIEEEILLRLRGAIIGGQFAPGAYLNESEIAKQMGVSRIPIREALKKLEQEGLVVRQPNRGVFVITFSEQDVREVFSLRASLEGMAYEWAIPSLTTEDLAHLRELIAQQGEAVRMKDYGRLAELDMRFHETICIRANHSRLLKAWYEQHAQCQMLLNLRFQHMAEYTPETVRNDHERLVEAIEARDSQGAIQLTQEIAQRVAYECAETLRHLARHTARQMAAA